MTFTIGERLGKVFRQQMTEVLTNYGPVREVRFDGSCRINVNDILERYASDAVILQGPMANLRWVGNEDGYAPFSNWYTLSSKDLKTGVATAKKIKVSFTNKKAEPQIANFAVYYIEGVSMEPEKRNDNGNFYDGIARKRGTDKEELEIETDK